MSWSGDVHNNPKTTKELVNYFQGQLVDGLEIIDYSVKRNYAFFAVKNEKCNETFGMVAEWVRIPRKYGGEYHTEFRYNIYRGLSATFHDDCPKRIINKCTVIDW